MYTELAVDLETTLKYKLPFFEEKNYISMPVSLNMNQSRSLEASRYIEKEE